jgi:hypothetical protein
MVDDLDAPISNDSLYLARGEDVNELRPLMQGDVFSDVAVPGLDDEPANILILTHPCSMRHGPHLADRLLVARVRTAGLVTTEQWRSGHFRKMPLPDLGGSASGDHHAAEFEDVGALASDALVPGARVACLDPYGIGLLQQRFVHYLTRVVVPLDKLSVVCGPVFAEADLLEEWIEAAVAVGRPVPAAEESFDAFIRDASRPGGRSLQDDLKDPLKRAAVTRAVRNRIAEGL